MNCNNLSANKAATATFEKEEEEEKRIIKIAATLTKEILISVKVWVRIKSWINYCDELNGHSRKRGKPATIINTIITAINEIKITTTLTKL